MKNSRKVEAYELVNLKRRTAIFSPFRAEFRAGFSRESQKENGNRYPSSMPSLSASSASNLKRRTAIYQVFKLIVEFFFGISKGERQYNSHFIHLRFLLFCESQKENGNRTNLRIAAFGLLAIESQKENGNTDGHADYLAER